MIYYSLPGIDEFKKLNIWFLELYRAERICFFDDVIIDNIYGSVPGVIWNGGRNSPIYPLAIREIQELFDTYKEYGVKLRFTFTNALLSTKELSDKYANEVLGLIAKNNGEITIKSDLLKSYIRENYSDIVMVSSTTKCILDLEELNNELSEDYKLVVLDFRKNADFDFLKKIKKPHKIELLVNEDCFSGCTQRERHYRDISENILLYDRMPDTEYYCPGKCKDLYDSFKQETTIKADDLYGKYYNMGFCHAKLRGRRSDYYDVLESYIYYLIKPQYRDRIRLRALKSYLREEKY